MRTLTRTLQWLAIGLLVLALPGPRLAGAAAPASAPADTVYGLTPTGLLVKFSSATPGTFDLSVPITGTGRAAVVAIDFRPKTGELYALVLSGLGNTAAGRLYTLNTTTGLVTPVGVAFSSFLSATAGYDIDFNPASDRLRLVNTAGINLRLNPNTGALAATDTSLTCATPPCQLVGVAYDRTTVGVTATTLYGLDWLNDTRVTIGTANGAVSPNTGIITGTKPLGVDIASPRGGFDIAPSGTAYAALKVGLLYGFYTVNLSSGAATLVGLISNGSVEIADIAVPSRFSAYLPLTRK